LTKTYESGKTEDGKHICGICKKKSLTEERGFLIIANCILLCTDLIIAQNAIKILILKTY
jgi:RNA polymerase subunit RPABC4/transcription elongation factor Spt4